MTEKEGRILEATLELLNSGVGPHTLKISEIAQLAGVGKGTVYEYFETKEQLLVRAVLFSLEREIDSARSYILERRNFYDQFMAMLDMAARTTDSGFSGMRLLMSGGGERELCDQVRELEQRVCGFSAQMDGVMAELLERGYQEGVICRPAEDEYAMIVLRSAMAGYAFRPERAQDEAARQVAFDIVRRTLK